ncbi:MAG: hypothetical protein A3G33_10460 [Omnitrophica bacterium RIFCSPLOWO2_12_FULL_44_17]|uniref:Polyamine aminopropyltransferase n=1 Tax=Candidatus Danuiimicrobium aquiferis TaxID=1801832 RepID=A0A1G1KR38_9BACT|nr:MAG: hypothetical protein A3B72_02775 [Omnitrophica bacterium RIFCSPHIGHO2_02_FULL_45_28]OGW95396.1 MAG: hypothetical protein A3G33_10460 [Omnitrophica bacterium RIFCSPLOWO2_12_FULL_44_17]OGX03281.1 MAG: hypothetical protein A3J12_07090 [Omnitrophica bacterium RIFCSPLOWO2_02_FULL_44_11]
MDNFIFTYYGFFGILSQLIIFRELSVLFYGNELFLGTFLSSWLFWIGSGSLFVKRLFKKELRPKKYFSYGFLVISFLFPNTILIIRISKNLFPFGEFIGPVGTIVYTFAVMSCLCFIVGSQFSLACAVTFNRTKKETSIGQVYLYEALGAAIGGTLFTYLLIGTIPTFVMALVLSLTCVFVAWNLSEKIFSIKSALIFPVVLAILFFYFKAEPAINRFQWKKYQFIEQKETRNITYSLLGMGSIKNVFADGMLSANFPNPESYEPAVHWPLLATAAPRHILILGDSSLGTLKEALKHNPKSVDYVVLDRSFIDLIKPRLNPEDLSALEDPRVYIHYSDARFFIRKTQNKYDDIIINIPEVPNLKLNRFYTREFFNRARSVLEPDGIFALSITSSENYLSEQTKLFNASVYRTLQSVFKAIEVIPGDSLLLLASPSVIGMQKESMTKRLADRKILNRYVIPSYLEYKLEPKRRLELKELLAEMRDAKINRDFDPTTCFYFANFWFNKFASPLGYLALGASLLLIAFVLFKKKKSFLFLIQRKECLLLFILGFMSILLELILLLSFQIISGDVYWQMGILFASFMCGLFLGSALSVRFQDSSPRKLIALLALLSLTMIGLSVSAGYFLPHLANLSALQNILIFLSLFTLIGMVVGAAFVIAGFLTDENDVMEKAGNLYAADLWGAALGAVLTSNFIIPFLGILGTLNFSAFVGLIGLVIFLFSPRNKG